MTGISTKFDHGDTPICGVANNYTPIYAVVNHLNESFSHFYPATGKEIPIALFEVTALGTEIDPIEDGFGLSKETEQGAGRAGGGADR
ncbi:MAG: hypothetical protein QNK37_28560 [Acidobacteriota bacterium]|nr:hypothetical protein [Acidobacteriota bacterium]